MKKNSITSQKIQNEKIFFILKQGNSNADVVSP